MARATDGSGYFLYHSIGQFPDKARLIGRALEQFCSVWGRPDDAQWMQALQLRQQFIDHWCRLINAPAGTLTSAENVTTALYSLIGALPGRCRGKRVLIAADCFPSLHFLLSGMAERHGFVLDTVPLREGEHWVRDEDMLARWGDDVAVALLTLVTSTASHRCDVGALIEHGHRQGSLVGVDITQGIGLLPYDAQALQADFTVSTSLKWLGGTPGAGILQVREALLGECRPELRGWFSQENIFSWGLDDFQYAADARRFDHGTPSVLACVGSLPALKWHAEQDASQLLAHNRSLSAALIAGADALGVPLASPREDDRRGGSVMLKLPAGVDPGGLVGQLRQAGLFTDCRGNILRLSPGCMTTHEGVQHLLVELEQALASAG